MSTGTDDPDGGDIGNAQLLEAATGAPLMLPEGFALTNAEFDRSGADLVLTTPDGDRVVIRDFFAGEAPPVLMTPEGAQISAALATKLAGPLAPGQVAQAGAAPGMEAIGKVETVNGQASVIRADGTREALDIDTPLFAGDILETAGDGALGVVLADETTFAMGAEGRMVLDEMIYDPETQEGSLSLSVLKGVYTVVSGLVSKTDPDAMTIETPVATIGIRGTQLGLEFVDGKALTVVMMREADGYVGEVFIRNDGGVEVLNQAHQVVFVGSFRGIPRFLDSVDDAGVVGMFGATLSHLPITHGRENDYSTQPATDGGAPEETIRVVEGDYTEPETVEDTAIPVPEAPAAAPVAGAETAAAEDRRDEDIVIAEEPAEEPTPTVPVISVSAASGAEDTAIPLTIAVTVPGTAELASLIIGGVPEGATLSAGGDNGDGTWTLAGADLDNLDTLAVTPPADWSGAIDLSVTATSTDGGTASAGLGVAVTAVPDLPVIGVSAASGGEDTAIPLAISASVPGTETLASLTIAGVPEGATLSAGTDNGDGTWTLAGADLDNLDTLAVTPPADWSGNMDLSVTATSTDGGTASAGLGVAVTAVPDLPVIGVSAASGAEDTAIPLTISASVPGTETLASLTIAGVPEGATLSAGTDNGDGTWTLAGADLDNLDTLALTPPAGSSADLTLDVTATSTDGGTATAGFGVAVTAVADQPSLQVADVTVDTGGGLPGDDTLKGTGGADTLVGGGGDDVLKGKGGADVLYGDSAVAGAATVPLDVQASLADVDGSESLSVTIAGVPEGGGLSAGTDNGDGSWTLTAGELAGLDLTLAEGYQGDFQLQVTAVATDTDADTAATDQATQSATITVAFAGGGEAGDDELRGGGGDDVLYGGGGEDELRGDGDDDVLYGEAGDDELDGGKGDDQLFGGGGNDVLDGGEGADVLSGGAGNDVLDGGEGQDTFVFDAASGNDFIKNYQEGEELRFEGPEFSEENLSVTQKGDDVSIMFGNQNVEVTLSDVTLDDQGYTVTREADALVITFKDTD